MREGWDNPNVFVLGVLKRSDNTVSRRQEIGRGLRLSVDQRGERTDDPVTVHSVNELTVVTDESYTAFVDGLQREVSESPGRPTRRGGRAIRGRPTGEGGSRRRSVEDDAGAEEFGAHVAVDSGVLIGRCVVALDYRLRVAGLRYVVQQGELRAADLAGQAGSTVSGASVRLAFGSTRTRQPCRPRPRSRTT